MDRNRVMISITLEKDTKEMLDDYCHRNGGSSRSRVIDAVLRWFLGQEPQVSPMHLPRKRIADVYTDDVRVVEDAPLAKTEWVPAANDEPQVTTSANGEVRYHAASVTV